MKINMISIVIILLLTACGSMSHDEIPNKVLLETKDNVKACPDAIIDYIDALMWNDIIYEYIGDESSSKESLKFNKGNVVGEIDYTLLNNACMDYKMKSGDATFLPKGTKVYEVKGYKPTFRLVAGEKLYQSNDNPRAKIVSDVYDIQGKVSKISVESTDDGHQISVFTEEAMKEFIKEYLTLEYIGFEKINKSGKGRGDRGKEFLRIYLDDDTSFRIVYWTEQNIISPGAFGTDRLKTLMLEHVSMDYFSEPKISEEQAKSIVLKNHTKNIGKVEIISFIHENNEYIIKWENRENCESGTDYVDDNKGEIIKGVTTIC